MKVSASIWVTVFPWRMDKQAKIKNALAIQGYMNVPALEWLAIQAESHHVIVELGCFCGRSTRALADNTPGVVYAIDDWKGVRKTQWGTRTKDMIEDGPRSYLAFMQNMQDLLGTKVQPICVNHAEAHKIELPHGLPDMVFIDGDHDYESVKRDIEVWGWRKNVFLCGDDISWIGVEKAVKELVPNFERVEGTDLWYRPKHAV